MMTLSYRKTGARQPAHAKVIDPDKSDVAGAIPKGQRPNSLRRGTIVMLCVQFLYFYVSH